MRIVHLDNRAEVDYNGVVRDPTESGTNGTSPSIRDAERPGGQVGRSQGGKVIEAADNADALFKRLRAKQIRDASVLRVPAEQDHEAELVGLG